MVLVYSLKNKDFSPNSESTQDSFPCGSRDTYSHPRAFEDSPDGVIPPSKIVFAAQGWSPQDQASASTHLPRQSSLARWRVLLDSQKRSLIDTKSLGHFLVD